MVAILDRALRVLAEGFRNFADFEEIACRFLVHLLIDWVR